MKRQNFTYRMSPIQQPSQSIPCCCSRSNSAFSRVIDLSMAATDTFGISEVWGRGRRDLISCARTNRLQVAEFQFRRRGGQWSLRHGFFHRGHRHTKSHGQEIESENSMSAHLLSDNRPCRIEIWVCDSFNCDLSKFRSSVTFLTCSVFWSWNASASVIFWRELAKLLSRVSIFCVKVVTCV